MISGWRFLVGAVAALVLSGLAAEAATYKFEFDKVAVSNQSSKTFYSTPGGLSVDVVGRNYTLSGQSFVAGSAIDVETNSSGLISQNCTFNIGFGCWAWEEHTIDSYGADEAMVFTFDKAVKLAGIVIGWFEGSGYYDLFAGNGIGGLTLIGNTKDGPLALPTGSYTTFAIGARTVTKNGWTKESGIKIKTLTVDYTPYTPPPPATVPLPAGGLLLLGALGGLAALRRRKTA